MTFRFVENTDDYLRFYYKNHRGDVAERTVSVPKIEYGTSAYYPDFTGWFITAFDKDRQAIRSFKMENIMGFIAK